MYGISSSQTRSKKEKRVKVALCNMHNMMGDFFTKPLQGALFVPMKERISKSVWQYKYDYAQDCFGAAKKA